MIAIVLLPEFSDLVLTLIRELLRISQLTRLCRFTIVQCSVDGESVFASNGQKHDVDFVAAKVNRADAVLVCASYNPTHYLDRRLMAWLRRQQRHGAVIGGVDTGPFVLAEAGLLDGKRATLHWDELEVARLRYPNVDFVSALIERDGAFITSCGSLGTIEFTLEIIAHFAGRHVADRVVGLTGKDRDDEQLAAVSPQLAKAIHLMRQNIEMPLSIGQIASAVGLSTRQMVRLFRSEFSKSPIKYYLELRLGLADDLLRKTRFSVSEIAAATGFASLSWFSRSYRKQFELPPSSRREVK